MQDAEVQLARWPCMGTGGVDWLMQKLTCFLVQDHRVLVVISKVSAGGICVILSQTHASASQN